MKRVYVFDADGPFVGPYDAQESPLDPGVFLVPQRSTDIAPPAVTEAQFAQWNGTAWDVIDIPPPPPPPPPTPEEIAAAAQAAQDLADRQETQADAKFRALINRTPTQVRNWVRSNFPSLTLPEQNDLATIVQAIAILARRL